MRDLNSSENRAAHLFANLDRIETRARASQLEVSTGKRMPVLSDRQRKLRERLLAINYSIAAIVFVLFLLTAKGFSIAEWAVCVVLLSLIPLFATYIQLTQIGLGVGLLRMLNRTRR